MTIGNSDMGDDGHMPGANAEGGTDGADPGDPGASAERVTALRGNPERVLTFTDGVFAIIITILVLDVRVPENLGEASLAASLEDVAPTLVAWLISFLITGMYWVWHRDVFVLVRAVNRDVVWLNLLFLVPVALIPFASSLIGQYDRSPVALRTYGAVLVAASVMRVVLFRYLAGHPELLVQPLSRAGRRLGSAVAAAPLAIYGLAMALASVAPAVSLVLYALVPVLYFAVITALRSRSGDRQDADDYS